MEPPTKRAKWDRSFKPGNGIVIDLEEDKQEKEIEASVAFGASMHAVAEAFCDIVIKLDANFCVSWLSSRSAGLG